GKIMFLMASVPSKPAIPMTSGAPPPPFRCQRQGGRVASATRSKRQYCPPTPGRPGPTTLLDYAIERPERRDHCTVARNNRAKPVYTKESLCPSSTFTPTC